MATDIDSYKSPKSKLLDFFRRSRDKWKEKCAEAKARIKILNNRVRFLEQSKEKWKTRAKQQENENAELRGRLLELEKKLEEVKKKKPSNHLRSET